MRSRPAELDLVVAAAHELQAVDQFATAPITEPAACS
jgi:hypothetical protein